MTTPSPIVEGIFDVQVDSDFALEPDTVELDAYALKSDGNTTSTVLAVRYAQTTAPSEGASISKFIRSDDHAAIAELPPGIRTAFEAVVADATQNQQADRMLEA